MTNPYSMSRFTGEAPAVTPQTRGYSMAQFRRDPVDLWDEDEEESYGLVGFGKFILDAARQTAAKNNLGNLLSTEGRKEFVDELSETFARGQYMGQRVITDVDEQTNKVVNYLTTTPISNMLDDAADFSLNVLKAPLEMGKAIITAPGETASSFADALIQKPIEAIIGMKNEGGRAVPQTAEEQYQGLKDAAGLIADIYISRNVFRGMIKPKLESTRRDALWDITKANAVSGAVGGAAGGAIAGFNEEDMGMQMVVSTLISAPMSVVFGNLFDYPSYMRQVKDIRMTDNAAKVGFLNAMNTLREGGEGTLADVIMKSEVFSTMDNVTKAAIASRLINNLPAMLTDVTEEGFKNLVAEFEAGIRAGGDFRAQYKLPENVKLRTTPFSREVSWNNDFDRVAYNASKTGNLSATQEAAIADVLDKAGGTVTREDLIAHGKMLRQRINNAQKNGEATMPDQATIDARTRGIIDKGFDIIAKSVDGQSFKDAQGADIVRRGDMFINQSTGASYPVGSQELAAILGARGSLAPNAPRIDYGNAEYAPNFGKATSGNYFKYYSAATREAIISPNPLTPASEALFNKTGFMIGENVVFNGKEYVVSGYGGKLKNQPDRIKIVDVASGEGATVNAQLIARNLSKPSVDYFSASPIQALHRGTPKGVNPLDNSNTLGGALFYTPGPEYAKHYIKGTFGKQLEGAVSARNIEFKNLLVDYKIVRESIIDGIQQGTMQRAPGLDATMSANYLTLKHYADKAGIKLMSPESYIEYTNALFQKYKSGVVVAQEPIIQLAREAGYDGIKFDTNIYAFLPDVNAKLPGKLTVDSPIVQKVFDGFYNRFLKEFIEAQPNLNFNQKFDKFFAETKLPMEQRTNIRNAMLKRMQDDMMKHGAQTDPLYPFIKQAADELNTWASTVEAGTRSNLENLLNQNSMYLKSIDQGKFEIHFDDGRILGVVDSLEDAMAMMQKSGKGVAIDGTGGGTGQFPPEIAGLAPLNVPVKYSGLTPWGKKVTEWRAGRGGVGLAFSAFTNLPTKMSAMDEWLRVSMGDNAPQLFRLYDLAAQSHDAMKNFFSSPTFKPVTEKYNRFAVLARDLGENLQPKLVAAAEAMSIDDIIQRGALFGRNANPVEVQLARQIGAKQASKTVAAILEEISMNGSDLATASKVVQDRFKTEGIAYVPQGAVLAGNMLQTPKEAAQWLPILEIAKRIEDPSLNVTQAEYLANTGLNQNGKFMAALKLQESIYQDAANILKLPNSNQIQRYFPHIRQAGTYNRWADTGLPKDFMNDIQRTGIMNPMLLRTNPTEVMHQYLMGVGRQASGFTENIKKIDELAQKELAKLPGDDGLALSQMWTEITDKARGVPDVNDKLANITVKAMTKVYGAKLGNSFIFDMVNTALQGALPMLGVRDFATGTMIAETLLGIDAMAVGMKKAFLGGDAVLEDMYARGIVPRGDPSDMVNAKSVQSLEAQKMSRRVMNTSMKISLQPQTYNKTIASTFFAAEHIAQNAIRDFQAGKMTMEQLLDKTKLSSEPLPVQEWFTRELAQGNTQVATDTYARWMTRKVANFYGSMYNPLTWGGFSGRLIGQYGSWSTNATSTMFDMVARKGNNSELAWRLAKLSTMSAAIVGAGAATGLNLNNWLWSPIYLPQGSPLLGAASDISRSYNQALNDATQTGDVMGGIEKALNSIIPLSGPETGNYTRTLIPFSRAMTAWAKGYDMMQYENAGIKAILRALGTNTFD